MIKDYSANAEEFSPDCFIFARGSSMGQLHTVFHKHITSLYYPTS